MPVLVLVLVFFFVAVTVTTMPVLVLVLVFFFVVVVTAMSVTMMMFVLFFKLVKFALEGVGMLHCRKNSLAVKFVPSRSDNRRVVVVRFYKLDRRRKLICARNVCVAENYARRRFNLVVEKLAEVLHIHFALSRVYHRGVSVDFAI